MFIVYCLLFHVHLIFDGGRAFEEVEEGGVGADATGFGGEHHVGSRFAVDDVDVEFGVALLLFR